MAEAPIKPLATDAYLADTTHLSATEHGAYLLLLMTMWRAGGRLPNNPAKLARFARLSPTQFKRVWPVLEGFFFEDGDQIGQGKLDDFLDAVRQKSVKASDSARAKWRKNKKRPSADASPEECERDAIHDPANHDPIDADERASAPEVDQVREAAGIDPSKRLPQQWLDPWVEAEIGRWKSLDLSLPEILAVLRAVAAKRGGPPSSPTYFARPMQEAAGAKSAPALRPIEGGRSPPVQPIDFDRIWASGGSK